MDLKEKLIRLAHANPELRPHILPLLKRTAVVKPQKSLMIDRWRVDRVRDDYTEGEQGRHEDWMNGRGGSDRFKNPAEIMSWAEGNAAAPNDKKSWDPTGWDNGQISATWLGDNQGIELPKSQIDLWKKGALQAYSYYLVIQVMAASVYTPSAKELKAWR